MEESNWMWKISAKVDKPKYRQQCFGLSTFPLIFHTHTHTHTHTYIYILFTIIGTDEISVYNGEYLLEKKKKWIWWNSSGL